MTTLWKDIRFGTRSLLKSRAFTFITVLTLALGIGANTAIFSVVNAVLLQPLPFKDPEQLVMVYAVNPRKAITQGEMAPADFAQLREQNTAFEQLSLLRYQEITLTGQGEPDLVDAGLVSSNFFHLLGVEPVLGRNFLPEDEQGSQSRGVILSHGLWERRFGSNRSVIGQPLALDGKMYTVAGVLPADFEFPKANEQSSTPTLWVPTALEADALSDRRNHVLVGVGRLKKELTVGQAQAELKVLAARLEQQSPQSNAGWSMTPVLLREQVVGNTRTSLLVLFGAVGLVLLITCANVANLLLVRASARQKEIALRTALGAPRSRIIRQLLTEATLLALAGGVLGIFFAIWGVNMLVHVSPGYIPRVGEIGIDLWVLGFTILISVLVGLVFGLAPALQASAPDQNQTLKEGAGKGAGGGQGRTRTRAILVVSEVALSLMLLISAGLLIKSFVYLLNVSPGFNPDNLMTMNLSISPQKYSDPQQRANFYTQVIERVSALTGVRSVGATNHLPLGGGNSSISFIVEGRPLPGAGEAPPTTNWRAISPDYLRTMGIPLLRGRAITERDKEDVILISESMARRFWPQEDPLGKRIRLGGAGDGGQDATVVGVVGDVHHWGLEAEPLPQIYLTYLQDPPAHMTFVVRSAGDPRALASSLRATVGALDKDLPVTNLRTMDEILADSVARRRFVMILFGAFAVLALLLAAVGIYGVISYYVAQRTQELGIRIALGARPLDIVKLVVGQSLLPTVAGIVLGLAVAFVVTRVMSSLLYGISATDPLTFIGMPLVLLGVALLATFIPARRATKVDPLVALKY
ncbi:MAG: ABC transporter permease [Pyrinomonadaceae bacterium]